jgi:choline dehydrogenase
MREYTDTAYRPDKHMEGEEEIKAFCRQYGTTIFHPVGTCRMGRDRLSVVDSRLRVHGLRNLRIADASIMPTIVSGNTSVPATMIGEKAADYILEGANAY